MRKLALGVAMLVATGTSALAGGSIKDGPGAGPAWTGYYAGIQVGAASADWNYSNAISTPGVGPFAAPGFPLGGFDGSGLVGGVHAGYNSQRGNLLAGIEVDVNWSNLDETRNFLAVGIAPGLPFTLKSSLESYGTVRGRLGYAEDRMLIYATGGFAWAASQADIVSPGQFSGPFATSDHNVHVGWTAGAGIDFRLNPQWVLGLEYKHIDLGKETYNFTFPAATVATSTDLVLDEVTLRLSRKF